MKPLSLLVLSNSVKALIYTINEHNEYELLKEFEHEAGHLKSSSLVSDSPGRYQSGSAHGSYASQTNPHENEKILFAKEIIKFLESGRKNNKYNKIILCAEPKFYGLLEKHATKELSNLIHASIKKDYIPLQSAELNKKINEIIKNYY